MQIVNPHTLAFPVRPLQWPTEVSMTRRRQTPPRVGNAATEVFASLTRQPP